jgi:3-phenylpropionate/trans-cinnamate dioxygenase ferredoxin subunit
MSEYQPAASLSDLQEGQVTGAKVAGRALALYLVDGRPYCTDDLCPHEDCFFTEVGIVEGDEVECSCHGSRFNIKTGENTAPPSADPVRTYPARVDGDQVSVSV